MNDGGSTRLEDQIKAAGLKSDALKKPIPLKVPLVEISLVKGNQRYVLVRTILSASLAQYF